MQYAGSALAEAKKKTGKRRRHRVKAKRSKQKTKLAYFFCWSKRDNDRTNDNNDDDVNVGETTIVNGALVLRGPILIKARGRSTVHLGLSLSLSLVLSICLSVCQSGHRNRKRKSLTNTTVARRTLLQCYGVSRITCDCSPQCSVRVHKYEREMWLQRSAPCKQRHVACILDE